MSVNPKGTTNDDEGVNPKGTTNDGEGVNPHRTEIIENKVINVNNIPINENEAEEEAVAKAKEAGLGGGKRKSKGKSKKVSKKPVVSQKKKSIYKEIFGKQMKIYKMPYSRKEYVKYKGELLHISDYKDLMKQKLWQKPKLKPRQPSKKQSPKPKPRNKI